MILKAEELSVYAKKCTTNKIEAERGIREAEWYDIVPSIGAALYERIDQVPVDYEELLNGGVSFPHSGCVGGVGLLQGLKTAIAYFAEARICKGNNVQLDRFGANIKSNEYSSNADPSRISEEAVYLHTCGDKAMESVLGYIQSRKDDPLFAPFIQKPNDEERTTFESINFLNP